MYLKVFFAGSFGIIIAIFAVFSIYWGALWKIPDHNLQGWIVVCVLLLLHMQNVQRLIITSPRTSTMAK